MIINKPGAAFTTVQSALDLARQRAASAPSFNLYSSCVAQLEYLLAALTNEKPRDLTRLRQIIVGHYGVREFGESDPEFAAALVGAQAVASRLGAGLKAE